MNSDQLSATGSDDNRIVVSSDKVALVTAGGSGMGAGAARKLAANGFRVGILSWSGKGKALAKKLDRFSVTGCSRSDEDFCINSCDGMLCAP